MLFIFINFNKFRFTHLQSITIILNLFVTLLCCGGLCPGIITVLIMFMYNINCICR